MNKLIHVNFKDANHNDDKPKTPKNMIELANTLKTIIPQLEEASENKDTDKVGKILRRFKPKKIT